MCTIVIDFKPKDKWPVIIGANRDEILNRPWKSPGKNWPTKPNIFGGLDVIGKGSWLAINSNRVVASITNRTKTLGPITDKKSRGLIIIEALEQNTAKSALESMRNIDFDAYQDFNLLLADQNHAFVIQLNSKNKDKISEKIILPGLHMITSKNIDDPSCSRIKKYLPLFLDKERPSPDKDHFKQWKSLLSEKAKYNEKGNFLNFLKKSDFGTVSSSIIAIRSTNPQFADKNCDNIWLFSNRAPNSNNYKKINII
jgi:hypothetical protein